MSQSCGKVPSSDDVKAIGDSIKNPDPKTIEQINKLDPRPNKIDIIVKDGREIITAEYDKKGYLHIIRVYTENQVIDGKTILEGETHQTLSFINENYRISQDFLPDGTPKPNTAHIYNQNTNTVVWTESESSK